MTELSQSRVLRGFPLQVSPFRDAGMQEFAMTQSDDADYQKIPGLFRLWDLQFVFNRRDDYQVHYVEQTAGGTALFAVYRRKTGEVEHDLG